MIILPIHKKMKDEIIAIQLKEWLYQSHCWDAPDGDQGLKICQWCAARSMSKNKVDHGKQFCPENPIIKQIFQNAVQIIKNAKSKGEKSGWQDD